MTQRNLFECVACGNSNLHNALDLGYQPLANNLKVHTEPYPLQLNLCEDCWHMQLSTAVDPSLLFKDYLYVSGTSQTLRDYFDWFTGFVREIYPTSQSVLEIACNDGSQLDSFAKQGYVTYGVDPAENLISISSVNHRVICDFFSKESCSRHAVGSFDVIVAQNVVAHTANPLQLLTDAASLMHSDSLFLIQTSQSNMVVNNEFDTIYHEHISFFSLSSMMSLARRAGLYVIDAVKTPIHGTSWLFVLSKQQKNASRMQNLLDIERSMGLHQRSTYNKYSDNCSKIQQDLKFNLGNLRNSGFTLIGYGAAAKGMTLLNSIDESLDFIIDDNPYKQGLTCPGNMTPITSISALDDIGSNVNVIFVPLAWNFFSEIRSKIKKHRDVQDDCFLRYFPAVEIGH